ncbi:MAG: ribonuclease Z [Bacteroidia bacterium]
MSSFELTILGCSSATPTSTRNPTAQILQVASHCFLIDCGEATQIQLRKFKIKFQRIDHIFISHLHGDHYLGLMGLLSSMHLLGRTKELFIYCPRGLEEIINVQLKYSSTTLNYQIHYCFHDTDKQEILFEDAKISVETILLNHRIPCCGFLFREKKKSLNLRKDRIEYLNIPIEAFQRIKNGEDFTTEDGKIIPNSELTHPELPIHSYAFCSDTCYDESVIEQIKGVDLLYHEATFTEEMKQRARETHHSTAADAARVALKAGVASLLIGHYSARYTDLTPLLLEARSIFNETQLSYEGLKINLEQISRS